MARVLAGEVAAVNAVVCYEYQLGPLADDEANLAYAFLQGQILPVAEEDALLAAQLFNDAGRRRTLKTDALIAACAIRVNADFVTVNVADFEPLTAQGLRLLAA
ncbi:MAG: hypothetical protein L0H75_09650 [Nitrosospira sp.]|nr:hypothetical protein [Nitrosospira sp.]